MSNPGLLNGTIERHGKGFIVRISGKQEWARKSKRALARRGIVRENPEAAPAHQIYSKYFARKKLYLPHEYERAMREILGGRDVIVLGMTGYSVITPSQRRAWGLKPNGYKAACAGLLGAAYHALSSFEGIDVRFCNGASAMEVDAAGIQVARDLGKPQLGISCPAFMFYVEDDDLPIYVAANQTEYSRFFIKSVNVLIAANGRKQAFDMDIDAMFKECKHVIFVNLLRSICSNGGPPPFGPDGSVEDAVAAYLQLSHSPHRVAFDSKDPYRNIVNGVAEELVSIVRPLLTPDVAYGNSPLLLNSMPFGAANLLSRLAR